ncbi:amino acid racemase [uncultured Brevundimonas sp.]|uniref:aspartate/glutamate racemase family protein n=1 Tax=uncultured Brevundimonas sp. TaxID=213418 RepID=UPI0030EB55A7
MRVLGVLGGMGPAATVAFLARVQALTPATGDQDHIRMLVDINPQVPDRNRAPQAADDMLGEMAARLREAGAQILAMPCNTAHAQSTGLRGIGLPFIDMIAETTAVATEGEVKKVGVLATPGGEALYTAALSSNGAKIVRLVGANRQAFTACIAAVKRGDTGKAPRAEMRRLAAALVASGAERVIAGCTEVPLLLGPKDVSVPLIDSADVLARACVKACR